MFTAVNGLCTFGYKQRLDKNPELDVRREQEILNDYIHILREHNITEINKALDECECKLYLRRTRQDTRRRALIEKNYFARLLGNIHCYL